MAVQTEPSKDAVPAATVPAQASHDLRHDSLGANAAVEQTPEERMKHLEFIQAIINRLGQNSFLVKGWTITLAAAFLALAQTKASAGLGTVAFVPVLVMWGLDGFFLAQERRYRALFCDVAAKAPLKPFTLDVTNYVKGEATWWCSTTSKTVLGFHLPVVVVMAVALTAIGLSGGSSASS